MTKLAYREDCKIIRGVTDKPGCAVLIDGDGDDLFVAPEFWTDDQVWMALDFANYAYSKGVRVGRAEKAGEIRAAIENA